MRLASLARRHATPFPQSRFEQTHIDANDPDLEAPRATRKKLRPRVNEDVVSHCKASAMSYPLPEVLHPALIPILLLSFSAAERRNSRKRRPG